MKGCTQFFCCLVLIPLSHASTAVPIAPAPDSAARILSIATDGFAGSSINVVAGLQNTLFTHRNTQWAAFYAADGTLTLARRQLSKDTWTTARTAYRSNVHDAHNTVAIIADGDGYLHVAWDHHGNPLNYAHTVAPGSLELGPKQSMTGQLEARVTYPQFLRLPDGDLLFFHRDGRSGRGNLVLNRYTTRTRTWSQVQPSLIDGEGQRSAYTTATVDREGTLHLAWNWRDTPDVASNHDLCYARSADGGRTWTTSDGTPLTVPFTVTNAEYALRLPTNRSLMNPPAIAVDASGRPCLANYWCPEGSDIPQYHLVRYNGTAWATTQITRRTTPFVLAGTATKRPPISRSVLLPYRDRPGPQAMHLIYRDDERGGKIVVVSCRDIDAQLPTWELRDLTAGSVGAWEPSLDPDQATRRQELHLLVQFVEQRDGNDNEAASVPPTPVASLSWSPSFASPAE